MIYFIDEDMGGKSAYPTALRMKGFEVTTLPDATQALRHLWKADDVELAIIDVMLARGLDPDGNFPESSTNRGLETGLRLLELLSAREDGVFPRYGVLLSTATNAQLVQTIRARSDDLAIPYWRKEQFRSTSAFCAEVMTYLQLAFGGV